MAIDIHTENVAPLSRAARWVPPVRDRHVHPATLWRWAHRGLRGIRLEVVKVGGSTCTSKEALARFFARLSGDLEEPTGPVHRIDGHREIQVRAAEAKMVARAEGVRA